MKISRKNENLKIWNGPQFQKFKFSTSVFSERFDIPTDENIQFQIAYSDSQKSPNCRILVYQFPGGKKVFFYIGFLSIIIYFYCLFLKYQMRWLKERNAGVETKIYR